MRLHRPFLASLLVGLSVTAAPAGQSTQTSQPQTFQAPAAKPAKREQRPGLPQFGAISEQLSRGAQPTDEGFVELKNLGVGIVVNLRHEADLIARERGLVESQGMQYVSIPWRGKLDPQTEQVAQFLRLLQANPDKRVFVHCERGSERTGVMVACYRISHEHWTADQALDEMEAFRFRGLSFGHLKKFVRDFPSLLLTDPFLRLLGSS
jgi:protein tyrosine/serine phosphatase